MIPEIISVRHDDGSGFRTGWMEADSGFLHLHPEYEITLNITGNGTRVAGDSVEIFDRYDLVLYGPDLKHMWTFHGERGDQQEHHAITCHFRRDSLGENLLSQYEMSSLVKLLEDSSRGIAFTGDTGRLAEGPMRRMLDATGMRKMAELFSLFDILCSAGKYDLLSSEGAAMSKEISDRRLTDVCNFVRENFYRNIPVKEAAVVAGLSPHSFSHFFSRKTGGGFVDYVNQVRVNKACYLLRETSHQVSDIVFECGFSTVSNFNKQFRRLTGTSATDYRAQFA